MRTTGKWLVVLAVGGILAFAVQVSPSVFSFQIAGYVIMAIAVLGLAWPRRSQTWLGRRMYVRRTRQLPDGEVSESSYPPYVLRNPGTGNANADIPDRPSIPPDPGVAASARRSGGHAPGDSDSRPQSGDTEVTEDVYEE